MADWRLSHSSKRKLTRGSASQQVALRWQISQVCLDLTKCCYISVSSCRYLRQRSARAKRISVIQQASVQRMYVLRTSPQSECISKTCASFMSGKRGTDIEVGHISPMKSNPRERTAERDAFSVGGAGGPFVADRPIDVQTSPSRRAAPRRSLLHHLLRVIARGLSFTRASS